MLLPLSGVFGMLSRQTNPSSKDFSENVWLYNFLLLSFVTFSDNNADTEWLFGNPIDGERCFRRRFSKKWYFGDLISFLVGSLDDFVARESDDSSRSTSSTS